MRLLLVLFGLMTAGFCNAQALAKKFVAIKPGTSEVDVIKVLGEPKSIENFSTVRNNSYDTTRYWRYENNVIIVFTNHAVETVEPKWENLLKKIQERANRKDDNGIKIISGE